jgi:hypothetical protein
VAAVEGVEGCGAGGDCRDQLSVGGLVVAHIKYYSRTRRNVTSPLTTRGAFESPDQRGIVRSV